MDETPKIVCLIGSTRFATRLHAVARYETLQMRIVLMPHVFGHSEPAAQAVEWLAAKPGLDALHRIKIAMADEVLFVTEGDYVGAGSRAEVAYARSLGKPVRFDPPCVAVHFDQEA